MERLLLALLFVPFLSVAQIINIPDPAFKAKLLAASSTAEIAYIETPNTLTKVKIDTNNDGEIQQSEADVITFLKVDGAGIYSMEGLQNFTNLTIINCNNNYLNLLDVSGMQHLRKVFCNNNNISSLDLTGLDPTFEIVECYGNNISDLQLPSSIKYVYCADNQITALPLAGFSQLEYLSCSNNQLFELDLSGTALKYLICSNNLLSVLDFSGLSLLNTVICDNNNLSVLDFSGNPVFEDLSCKNNNLTYVNVKNGNWNNFVDNPGFLSGNPDLHYMCGDEDELGYLVTDLNYLTGLDEIEVNSYCSFNPGGAYNTISGNVVFDSEDNGCDPFDQKYPYLKIALHDGVTTGYAFSDAESAYSFYTEAGNFTLTPVIENIDFFSVNPEQSGVVFPSVANTLATRNFCLAPNDLHPDVEVTLLTLNAARPGFDAAYRIVFRNKGNITLSGSIVLNFQEPQLDFLASQLSPDTVMPGQLTWSYTDLHPFEQRGFDLDFNVNSPVETPAVNIGDELNFSAMISPIEGDETPADNIFGLKQTVVGSFDPNDKHCMQGEVVSTTQIGNFLHYVINFENTGNFPAENVVIKDLLDADKFDISSLQVLGASHTEMPVLTGNKLEFYFEGINLAPNAYGYVAYKIKTKPTLTAGSVVTNKASIYFDFNAPVETNTATTTFQQLGVPQYGVSSVKLFPNPVRSVLHVSSESPIRSVSVIDSQGRVVWSADDHEPSNAGRDRDIDLQSLSSGVFFLRTVTDDGTHVDKIIKV